jgi:hypothetical protein
MADQYREAAKGPRIVLGRVVGYPDTTLILEFCSCSQCYSRDDNDEVQCPWRLTLIWRKAKARR